MRPNKKLKLHFINVNHGDATIIEFPDYGSPKAAHFAVVDFGAKLKDDRKLLTDYLQKLVDLRRGGDATLEFNIEFACVTHPHDDHFGGLKYFMSSFADPIEAQKNRTLRFWDCGFRTTSFMYNKALDQIKKNENLTFIRVATGSEFQFGETLIIVLAPSIDLRNRFDTYGIGKNDSSIVLRIKYENSYIILAGDAEYASWGKITEEFPRQKRITFYKDALGLAQRKDTSDQLRCNLLKIAHHGSKHGTSLEYLERLKPKYVVVPAGSQLWYTQKAPKWKDYFPHKLVMQTLSELDPKPAQYTTGDDGNIIFQYDGNWDISKVRAFSSKPGDVDFETDLYNSWK